MAISGWTIITIVIATTSIILLPYLWHRYHALRQHFLMSARFPRVSIFASICMLLCGLCTALNVLLLNLKAETLLFAIFNTIANITAFAYCSAILWRTLLIYDAWEMIRYTLKNKTNIILSADFVQDTTHTMYQFCGSFYIIYHKRLVLTIATILVLLVIIVSICTPLSLTNNSTVIPTFLFLLSWIIAICIGIFLVIKARKVKDAVLCIRETYFVIGMIFVQLILVSMPPIFKLVVGYFVDTVSTLFSAYLVIVVPLWMIYRHDGSLTPSKILKPKPRSNNSAISDTVPVIKQKRLSLYEYLNGDVSAYNELAEFLTQCFALENLLFYAKVLVFRQVLLSINTQKITKSDNEIEIVMEEDTAKSDEKMYADKWCPEHLRKTVYGVTFSYLDGLYDSCSPTDNVDIHCIAENIYDQYISATAINEVNISSYNRQKLVNFFTSKAVRDTEQYLRVFNGAIEEIYDVLDSVYRFKYNSVKKIALIN